MTKKLLCLILMVAMLSTFFVIGANAASVAESKLHEEQDFTLPEGEDGKVWRPDGWSITGKHGNAALLDQGIYNITEEGYVELCRNGYDVGACATYVFPTLPKDFTLMFDVRYPETSGFSGALYVDCSINGYKQSVTSAGAIAYADDVTGEAKNIGAGAHDANTWYTYVFQVKGDRMSVYRKSEREAAFTLKADNLKMQLRTGGEFYAYSTSPTAYIHIDNVKVFSGTYMTNAKTEKISVPIPDKKFVKSENENEPDEEVALDAEEEQGREYYYTYRYEYKIKGEIEVTSAKVSPTETGNVIPVMTIYDQKGKVIDMFFNTAELKYNTGNVYSLETPQYTPEAFEAMKGYTIEMYLWNSFADLAPQTAAYTTTIQ